MQVKGKPFLRVENKDGMYCQRLFDTIPKELMMSNFFQFFNCRFCGFSEDGKCCYSNLRPVNEGKYR